MQPVSRIVRTETRHTHLPVLCLEHFQDGIPELLRDISTFVLSLQQSGQATQPANGEPSSKKRKLEQPSESTGNGTNGAGSYDISNAEIDFECKDVSFTSPLRKKLRLQLLHESANKLNRQLRLINQATGEVEYTLRGQDIDCIFCLPVPEKAQRQQCFVVFPLPGSQSSDGTPAEPLVWTTNETKGQPEAVSVSTRLHRSEEDTFVDVTRGELDHFMASLSKKTILPDEREFASEIPQSHRKGEKAFHTKAFRGSKEGTSCLTQSNSSHFNSLTHRTRLPLPPLNRHSLRLQKARRLLPLLRNRQYLLHLRTPTHLQHRNHNRRPK